MPEKRRIMVIGSNSFSGSDFIDLLLEDSQNEVVGISRSPEKKALFLPYKRHEQPNFKFYQMDLNKDIIRIINLIDGFQPEYIVNFAAQSEVGPSWDNPDHWFQTNVLALSRLIHQLKDRTFLKRYVHISSPEVYGNCFEAVKEDAPLNPSTPYAASKAAADLSLIPYVKNYGFPLVTIRSTNVYGSHQQLFKIIPKSIIFLKLGRKIELHGGGRAIKSYIHIRDISRGELLAMEKGKIGSIYHLSPDKGYSICEIVKKICNLTGNNFSKSTIYVDERLGQDAAYIIDSTRARSELGWFPRISLEDGLKEVISWIEENWDEIKKEPLNYVHKP